MATESKPFVLLAEVTVSPNDSRKYRAIRLSSGLTVLLIQDENTDIACASLAVHVGGYSDPSEVPGLAHFLEHLLFMGTETFPDENAYHQFLSTHSGWSNAYTTSEFANYHFEVGADHISGALDRFASFFICPLFKKDSVDREMNAVHSEHQKNLQQDDKRISRTIKCTSSPIHPFSKFITGDLSTLNVIGIREKVIDFYQRYYSASIMSLTIYGKNSLDELCVMAVERFSAVSSTITAAPSFTEYGTPLTTEQFGTLLRVKPIKETQKLQIIWQLPPMLEEFHKKFGSFVSHLVGHGGKGSILSVLKARKLASKLYAYCAMESDFSMITILVELTENGLERYAEAIEIIIAYLHLLRNNQQEWLWIFEECAQLNGLRFRFKEKPNSPSDYAISCSHNLLQYPVEHVLDVHYHWGSFDQAYFTELFSYLECHNFRVVLVGNDFDPNQMVLEEKFYKTEYQLYALEKEFLERLTNITSATFPELCFPERNAFIARNFEIYGKKQSWSESAKSPTVLIPETSWYKMDDFFALPTANVSFLLEKGDFYYANVHRFIMSLLLIKCFAIQNAAKYHNASIAKLFFSLALNSYGISIRFYGFSDKLCDFVQLVMADLTKFQPEENFFDIVLEAYEKEQRNFPAKMPSELSACWIWYLLANPCFSYEEILNEISNISFDDFTAFCSEVFSKTPIFIKSMFLGNIQKETSLRVERCVKSFFNVASNSLKSTTTSLKKNSPDFLTNYYRVVPNVNNCVELDFKCGDICSLHDRTMTKLFVQIFHEAFFNQLRTIEQLGYVTSMRKLECHDFIGLRFIVQSSVKPCVYLQERILLFIKETCSSTFASMTGDSFEEHKRSLEVSLREPDFNICQEEARYFDQITSGFLLFTRAFDEADHLKSISLSDVTTFYREIILPSLEEDKQGDHFMLSLWLIGKDYAENPEPVGDRVRIGAASMQN